jgi:hypothetical protein
MILKTIDRQHCHTFCLPVYWYHQRRVNVGCYTKGGNIMVAGHLREQNGYYQMILSYKDISGERKTKSISTGLAIKGNKKRAEAMLQHEIVRIGETNGMFEMQNTK